MLLPYDSRQLHLLVYVVNYVNKISCSLFSQNMVAWKVWNTSRTTKKVVSAISWEELLANCKQTFDYFKVYHSKQLVV